MAIDWAFILTSFSFKIPHSPQQTCFTSFFPDFLEQKDLICIFVPYNLPKKFLIQFYLFSSKRQCSSALPTEVFLLLLRQFLYMSWFYSHFSSGTMYGKDLVLFSRGEIETSASRSSTLILSTPVIIRNLQRRWYMHEEEK